MSTLLSVHDLSVTFPGRPRPARAVDGISFDVAPGETLALVGESGCGKTVTALALLRLLPPPAMIGPASHVLFDGTDVLTMAPRALRRLRGARMSIVFQEPMTSLNPVLTIGTQIAETVLAHERVTHAAALSRAADMLALMGLADPRRCLRQYPHELSGGMRQRVLLAIALVCRPQLLIADEPTTALDVTVQAQILELLADLRTRLGMAMLLISHNLGIAAGIADRVAVMYGGRVVETATGAELFSRPTHPYTQGLLRAAPRLDGPARPTLAIPGTVPPSTAWPDGCRFHPRCARVWSRCGTEPPLLDAGTDHTARCWLVVDPTGAGA
jgi:peptide/nickel transport system ATP-binding protein